MEGREAAAPRFQLSQGAECLTLDPPATLRSFNTSYRDCPRLREQSVCFVGLWLTALTLRRCTGPALPCPYIHPSDLGTPAQPKVSSPPPSSHTQNCYPLMHHIPSQTHFYYFFSSLSLSLSLFFTQSTVIRGRRK